MASLTSESKPGSVTMHAMDGSLQDGTRMAPYLSFGVNGPAAITLFLETDKGTGSKLRDIAIALDAYWESYAASHIGSHQEDAA